MELILVYISADFCFMQLLLNTNGKLDQLSLQGRTKVQVSEIFKNWVSGVF